jgi:Flp pilus assembly protein TadG
VIGRHDRRRQRGQALVELALVLPILVVLLLGTVDVGRVIFAFIALEEAVQEGAAYAATMAPQSAADRYTKVTWRVRTSAGTAPDWSGIVVPNPTGVQCDSPSAGLITVTGTYALPLITPVGVAFFGNTFALSSTVRTTNIAGSCT